MNKKTIKDVVREVLSRNSAPLTATEIYSIIQSEKLYEFKTKSPLAVLKLTLKKNAGSVAINDSSESNAFKVDHQNRYSLT